MKGEIFLPSLVNELLTYNPPVYMRIKVNRVWRKCMRNGHFEIAKSIEAKYPEYLKNNYANITVK